MREREKENERERSQQKIGSMNISYVITTSSRGCIFLVFNNRNYILFVLNVLVDFKLMKNEMTLNKNIL